MKIFILITFTAMFSACAPMGAVLKGMGDGMKKGAHAPNQANQQTHYNPNYAGGYDGDDGSHCSPDYAGGYTCTH